MENLSHSLPNKSYHSNGLAGKTVYDDVFGGPPKFGVPTLSPRVEDYSEIFEGFHASRGSSIPILDLPAVDDEEADLFFDVRSSEFDYTEVFGGFNGLDFADSYEELFEQSTGGDDSSDEAWTPAQSESLSDESDPSAGSEKNRSFSCGDLHHSLDGTKQFNISYHKANPKGKEDMLNGVTHVTQLDALPGYSFIVNETLCAQKIEDENSHLRINQNADFGREVTEGKRLRKTVSQPPHSDFGVQEYKSEPNPLAGHDKASSPQKAFISVSDISLRTQPSHLPPPSRPPPTFTDRKGNSSRLNSKLKASKSYAFERMESDSSPPFFDVEVDASSSSAASAAAMKNAAEKAQAQLRSAKELMERKKEGLQSRTKLHLENDLEHSGEKINKFDRFNTCKGERVQSECEREGNEMKTYAAGQRKKVRNTTQVASGVIDGEDHIDAGKSALSDHGKEHTSSQVSHKTEGTVAWREETQFYEVVKPTKIKDKKTLEQHSKSHDCGPKEKGTGGALEQQEYNKRMKAARVDHEWEENGEQFVELKGFGGRVENKGRRMAAKGSTMQEEHQEKADLAQKVGEWQEKEKKTRVSPELGETEERLNELDKYEDCKILMEDQLEANELISEQKLKGVHESVEYEKRIKKTTHERKVHNREIKETFDSEEYERELKEDVEQVGNGRKLKKVLELGVKEEREKEVCGREEIEKKPEEALEIGQAKEKWEEAFGHGGKAKRWEDSGNRLEVDLKQQENKKEQYCACDEEGNEKNSKMALEQEKNAKKQEKAYAVEESEKRLINNCERDETEKRLKEACKQEEINKRPLEAHESDESEKGADVLFKKEGTEDRSTEANERVDCNNNIKDDNNCDGFSGLNSVHEQIKREENDRNLNQGIYVSVDGEKASDGACNLGETDSLEATQVAGRDRINGNLETQKVPLCEENGRLRTEPKYCEREMEAVEEKSGLIEGRFDSYGMDQSGLQHEKTNNKTKDSKESHDSVEKLNEDGDDIGGIHIDKSKGVSEIAFDTENAYNITHKHREGRKNINGVQIAFDQGENGDKFASSHMVREWVQHGREVGDVLPSQKFDSQSPERKEANFNEKLKLEEREEGERLKRERDLEDDRLRKMEEEKEREREREKDRMAVDSATCEARERALAEARDRAERAAVERATAEVRQRALAEACERLEKASAEARERLTAEKVSTEARLKAERAAVERATSEARERAFEKAMAEKASFAAHERMERSVSDNFLAYSRNGGLRQSSSSNLQDLQYGVGSSRDLKYSYSSVGGLEGESAQRCKARLERHQRTAERAAKALAEKNMRDLLAHKEQAERNRLAESLDADVKRWSSGKEGNLRALLSTLQYILGHDSGWKPIPLTDVITAVAVKKAYRKATLFVHPDKLQQRGASIQQKYICEKVFDLLKEAWNKFNSEER